MEVRFLLLDVHFSFTAKETSTLVHLATPDALSGVEI
jgi:hypothetical protein